MGRSKSQKFDLHDFYCLNCGNKGIGIMRKFGHQREPFHRKKLYCIYCKEEVNHVECKTFEEIEIFKDNFEKGLYVDEAKECMDFIRNSRVGQVALC